MDQSIELWYKSPLGINGLNFTLFTLNIWTDMPENMPKKTV